MMRRLWLAAMFVVAASAPAAAELTYTIRIEARKVATPATPANPMLAMMGSLVVAAIAPEGGLEYIVTVGEKGTRVDYTKAHLLVPAGGSTLIRPDGSMVIIDNTKRTYSVVSKPDMAALGGFAPAVTSRKTGQTATIAGLPAERLDLEIKVPLPVPPGTSLPPGLPTELVLTGEVWTTERFQNYAKLAAAGAAGFGGLGLDKLTSSGFMMRSVLRGEAFGDQEIEARVTFIAEAPAPASTFEIPAGFSEVPMPTTMPLLP